jgi:hypothetical protein
VASAFSRRKSLSGAPVIGDDRPAEWIMISTPASAAAMLIGRARSPITALVQFSRSSVGLRSKTRTLYPARISSRSRWLPMNPVAPVKAIMSGRQLKGHMATRSSIPTALLSQWLTEDKSGRPWPARGRPLT